MVGRGALAQWSAPVLGVEGLQAHPGLCPLLVRPLTHVLMAVHGTAFSRSPAP